jgi:hypothetical protein
MCAAAGCSRHGCSTRRARAGSSACPSGAPSSLAIFGSLRATSLQRETCCGVRIRVPEEGRARARYHHPGPATREIASCRASCEIASNCRQGATLIRYELNQDEASRCRWPMPPRSCARLVRSCAKRSHDLRGRSCATLFFAVIDGSRSLRWLALDH